MTELKSTEFLSSDSPPPPPPNLPSHCQSTRIPQSSRRKLLLLFPSRLHSPMVVTVVRTISEVVMMSHCREVLHPDLKTYNFLFANKNLFFMCAHVNMCTYGRLKLCTRDKNS
ncbi:hypothetical protein YC2023_114506 [Brassica napus]